MTKRSKEITSAIKVLEIEIEGLKALIGSLDSKFTQAVNKLSSIKGRVIVSGMGKSGHIARKIAATLSSTGTPSIFVHPAEASHGDLGMITEDDVVILLSNSGETAELNDIINYTRRFSIFLIGVVRKKTSMLVEAADMAFILPETPEASPIEAPTTSTTMMLAWGDALAMSLLEKRGFGAEDFNVFHPGGKLGSKFVTVEQLMRVGDDIPVTHDSDLMANALIVMTEKSLGCIAVVDNNKKPIGIITDGDLRRHMDSSITTKKVAEIMTKNPIMVKKNMLAAEALAIMNKKSITSLCVIDNKSALSGIVHIHDILHAGIS